jgi:hypothetical protein
MAKPESGGTKCKRAGDGLGQIDPLIFLPNVFKVENMYIYHKL